MRKLLRCIFITSLVISPALAKWRIGGGRSFTSRSLRGSINKKRTTSSFSKNRSLATFGKNSRTSDVAVASIKRQFLYKRAKTALAPLEKRLTDYPTLKSVVGYSSHCVAYAGCLIESFVSVECCLGWFLIWVIHRMLKRSKKNAHSTFNNQYCEQFEEKKQTRGYLNNAKTDAERNVTYTDNNSLSDKERKIEIIELSTKDFIDRTRH